MERPPGGCGGGTCTGAGSVGAALAFSAMFGASGDMTGGAAVCVGVRSGLCGLGLTSVLAPNVTLFVPRFPAAFIDRSRVGGEGVDPGVSAGEDATAAATVVPAIDIAVAAPKVVGIRTGGGIAGPFDNVRCFSGAIGAGTGTGGSGGSTTVRYSFGGGAITTFFPVPPSDRNISPSRYSSLVTIKPTRIQEIISPV